MRQRFRPVKLHEIQGRVVVTKRFASSTRLQGWAVAPLKSKRYGSIIAVNGLDLDVPEGTCVDEGELELLGFKLPDESSRLARCSASPAARQPGHDADGGAEPPRVRAPVPDRARRSARCDREGDRHSEARGSARLPRRQALRRDPPAPADCAGARSPAPARAPRRADRGARPPGSSGAVSAHRRAQERRHDDPHVHPLHRGGRASGRHRADHVARKRGGRRLAFEARERACRWSGSRGLRAAGAARGGRGRGEHGWFPHAAHRNEGLPPFTLWVLEELARVPYGKTTTHGALAARVGHPRAARAVGTVMNRNRIPIASVPSRRRRERRPDGLRGSPGRQADAARARGRTLSGLASPAPTCGSRRPDVDHEPIIRRDAELLAYVLALAVGLRPGFGRFAPERGNKGARWGDGLERQPYRRSWLRRRSSS